MYTQLMNFVSGFLFWLGITAFTVYSVAFLSGELIGRDGTAILGEVAFTLLALLSVAAIFGISFVAHKLGRKG